MYKTEYINCRICGGEDTKFLGIRGNSEYAGAGISSADKGHMATDVVRCKSCGFVYTNPLILDRPRGYDDADHYIPGSKDPGKLFGFNLRLIERYRQPGRLLDIGCGKGEFLSAAKKKGWEAFGLEPSADMAEYARKNYSLKVGSGPIEKAGYEDNFFDVVTLNMVLEHVDEPHPLLRHVKRITKTGGIIFIEVPNTDSLTLKAATAYFRLRGRNWSPLLSPLHEPFHSYGYNAFSIRRLLNMQHISIRQMLIIDSGLRGFRPDGKAAAFEKFMRNGIARFSGLIGKGDVLMVIAQKQGN